MFIVWSTYPLSCCYKTKGYGYDEPASGAVECIRRKGHHDIRKADHCTTGCTLLQGITRVVYRLIAWGNGQVKNWAYDPVPLTSLSIASVHASDTPEPVRRSAVSPQSRSLILVLYDTIRTIF